jgi:hypothetical protein
LDTFRDILHANRGTVLRFQYGFFDIWYGSNQPQRAHIDLLRALLDRFYGDDLRTLEEKADEVVRVTSTRTFAVRWFASSTAPILLICPVKT